MTCLVRYNEANLCQTRDEMVISKFDLIRSTFEDLNFCLMKYLEV